ncbi:PCSK1 [Bugula neritina]|uniref:PCSK1 n=1 Tax=Bugula neritina TaxID=10212 RepID=A0A7J7KI05_BUGNE|nr:PCSK1 [Bugula neritina]
MFNAKNPLTLTLDTDGCQKSSLLDDTSRVDKLEHVQMHVYLDTPRRGDIRLTLTSPAGTSSEMLSPRRNDDSKDGIDFTFMTVRCWNERPTGKWSLTVTDTADDGKNSLFYSWSLTLLGTAHSASTRDTQSLTSNRAFIPSQDILDKLINMEADAAVNVKIKLGSEVDVIKDFSSDSQITNDSGVTPTSPSDLALHLITSADRETSAADSLEASVSNILKGLSKHQVEQLIENFKRKVEIAKKERNIRRDQELYKLIEEYLDIS